MLQNNASNHAQGWGMTLTSRTLDAVAFCKQNRIHLQEQARSLLSAGVSTLDYFRALEEGGLYADARRILAHVLSRRRAIWWGCLCAWHVYRPQPPADVDRVLRSV